MLPTGFPCLLFHNDLLQDFVSYIFLNPKIKKVDALGRISACADYKLKPGYFLKVA